MEYLIITIVALLGIVKSADLLIDQSIALAQKLKVSSFIVGFTIIAFGTSLPELIVSLYSTYSGHPSIAISNVLGSNIVNICLILGILAVYKPYKLSKSDVFINIPLNLIALIFFIILVSFNNSTLNISSGIILLIVFIATLFFERKSNHVTKIKNQTKFNVLILIASLIALVVFGKISVDSILEFSKIFGVEETVLGYFVMAVGTSLPELVASFTAIKKGNEEIGIGNILGSNLFNLFFILGTASFIKTLDLSFFLVEVMMLTVITISLVILALIGKRFYFTRKEGILLLSYYIIFILSQLNIFA
jgi:cation:H+ antiporter